MKKDELRKKFNALPNIEKIQILFSALGVMQSYNGRTEWDCIAIAMGFELED